MSEEHAVYVDATVLIVLARIDRLDFLLLAAAPIHVTTAVWDEVTRHPEKPGVERLRTARIDGLIRIVAEGDPDAFPTLGPGESSVLSAASRAGSAILLDERKARAKFNTEEELRASIPRVTGVLGLILLAKSRGFIEVARPLLDELLDLDFRVSRELYDEVLRQAGEA